MAENNKKSSFKTIFKNCSTIIIMLFIGGSAGFFMGMLIAKGAQSKTATFLDLTLVLISFFIAFMIHIIFHEAGHLIFGLITKYEFLSFRVGSFTLVKDNGKLVKKKFSIKGTGGQCLMMPKIEDYKKQPYLLYNLGGVLVNIAITIIAIILYSAIDNNLYVNIILVSIIASGVCVIITNGIPMKIGGMPNDAYNIMAIRKDDYMRYCFYFQLKANGLIYKGKRIKDFPLEWVSVREDADLNNPLVTSLKVFEATYYYDLHDFDKAKESYLELLEKAPKLIKIYEYEIKCELLFLEIIKDGQSNKINELYTKELKSYIKATNSYISRKKLMYAYALLVECDEEKAKVVLKAIEKVKLTYPSKGEVESEIEVIEIIKRLYSEKVLHQNT